MLQSAQCWTDHLLFYATLSFVPVAQRKSSHRRRRFNILPLMNAGFVSQFTDRVVYLVKTSRNEDAYGLTKLKIVKDGLLEASNTMLGLSRRHQPDWFTESEDILGPLIDRCNKLFSVWLYCPITIGIDNALNSETSCSTQSLGVQEQMVPGEG